MARSVPLMTSASDYSRRDLIFVATTLVIAWDCRIVWCWFDRKRDLAALSAVGWLSVFSLSV